MRQRRGSIVALSADLLLLAREVVGIQAIRFQELSVALTELASREGDISPGQGHDHVKDRVVVDVSLGQGLHLDRFPRFP